MQKLKRITLTANEEAKISFDVKGYRFLVKNFGEEELYVSLGDSITDESTAFLIPSMGYQECFINENTMLADDSATNDIYLKSIGANIVEVQVTRW